MKRSFWSTIRGKFVTRTLLGALVPTLLIAGITLVALRSVSANAEESVDAVRAAIGDGTAIAPLDDFAADVSSASTRVTIMLVLAVLVGAAVATVIALSFARRVASPITQLQTSAASAAQVALPEFVSQIDSFVGSDDEVPELAPITVHSGDEIEDLSRSFNLMQHTATSLALEQARTRHQNVATFVNLGRRNQNLLARQIEAINSMEQAETNPEALEQLFHLDHLATRMRRNAESLLVLADQEAPRRFRKPVSMYQLVQAASGEIEHFGRVVSNQLDDAHVDGGPASDLAHLLAELLENATSFAPPGTPVEVSGRNTESGYVLQIVDRGIGMKDAALAEANDRVAGSTDFQFSGSTLYLGHFVVGRLAKRHGVHVELSATTLGGVTAQVSMPSALLASTSAATAATASTPPASTAVPVTPTPPETEAPLAVTPGAEPAPQPAAAELSLTEPSPGIAAVVEMAAPATQPVITSEPSIPPDQRTNTADAEPEAEVSSAEFAQLEAIEWALNPPSDVPLQVEPAGPGPLSAGVGPATVTDKPTQEVAGIAPATVPAGFRQRRRGHEGAPQTSASRQQQSVRVRRSPEEVQAALQRFSVGVATGRAASSDASNANEQSTIAGDNQ